MHKWKLVSASIFAAATILLLVTQLLPSFSNRAPTYDWQCAKCQYQFRHSVRAAADDRPIIDCPKCKTPSAERLMHYQCRSCWAKYDLRGANATLANIVCPACGSHAARDLDHLIPGDDEPVEGGKPHPLK